MHNPETSALRALAIETEGLTHLKKVSAETSQWYPIPKAGEVNLGSAVRLDDIQITQVYLTAVYEYLDEALREFTGFSKHRCDGYVVALSGGIDSAMCARLLQNYCRQRNKSLRVLIMGQGPPTTNCRDYPGTPAEWMDVQFATLFCQDMGLEYDYIDIADEYAAARRYYRTSWAISSQLPRIRANHFYSAAEEHDLIPAGTTNGSEYILVAFSKGGPMGGVAPLLDLYKIEVYAIARDIGVPPYIVHRQPLISELNINDYSLYGGGQGVGAAILDPILRRLWALGETPGQVAAELGHAERWIRDIYEKRIIGESCRRGFKSFVIGDQDSQKKSANIQIDRGYFI